MNIPKVIHYCWFGKGPKSKLAEICIESWRKELNDYKIIEWNEDNFDINMNEYVRQAYENKKYAFVTDYVRLYVLYNYGGIYFDTDVQVVNNLEPFLELDGFTGFESENHPVTATMASCKNNLVIKELLDYYENKLFKNDDGTLNLITNTKIITDIFVNKYDIKLNGEEQVLKNSNFKIYPKEYFCAKNPSTKELNITKNTFTIHHFNASWIPKKYKIKHKIAVIVKKIVSKSRKKL